MNTNNDRTFLPHTVRENPNTSESSSMVPGNNKWLIKFGVTLLLLIYLGFNMDWGLIGKTIYSIKIFPFIVSCMISPLSSIPLAIRLRILLKPTVLEFSLIRLIQVQFISQFYSLFLPSGVGVSIARWYKITQNRYGRRMFFSITVLERAMFLMTLLLCAGIPLLFAKDEAIQTFRSSILPVIFFLLVGCFLFFLLFLQIAPDDASFSCQNAQGNERKYCYLKYKICNLKVKRVFAFEFSSYVLRG